MIATGRVHRRLHLDEVLDSGVAAVGPRPRRLVLLSCIVLRRHGGWRGSSPPLARALHSQRQADDIIEKLKRSWKVNKHRSAFVNITTSELWNDGMAAGRLLLRVCWMPVDPFSSN